MSASREKKQRQGAGPSPRAAQAQQEQAARKRKTVIYTVIGVVVAVLVAALLIWDSGFFQSRATAASIGDTQLTTAELSYYYYGSRMYYANYGTYLGYSFDASVPDDEQFADEENNVTWRDRFMEEALTDAATDLARYDAAIAAGHTAAEVKESVESNIASVKSAAASNNYNYAAYLRAMYGPYMSEGVYKELITRYLLGQLVYNEKGLELYESYTEEDLKAYYAEHADELDTFEFSSLYFTPEAVDTKDADGNDLDEDALAKLREEALAEAKAKAEEALAEYEDGEDISHLIEHYQPSNSDEHSRVAGSGSISTILREQVLALKEGEAAIVENSTYGYYLVVFHGRSLSEEPTKDVRHLLIQAEPTVENDGDHDHQSAPSDEAWAAAKEKMDAIQAEWDASDKTEDTFAALANKYSDDGDGTTGGLIERIADNSNYVPEFLDWIFADGRKAGDSGVVQHSAADSDSNKYWGYHLMYLSGDNEPVWMASARNSLAVEQRTAWQTGLTEQYQTTLADGANSLGR